MAITIGTNIPALKTIGRLKEHTDSLQQSYARLSSGMRINRASDDAAGLAISQDLSTDVRVYGQAVRNINDSISALNIAEGGLEQLTSILLRQRELATQAANGSFSTVQRRSLNDEANELVSEFNRIVASTEFNGLGLFGSELDSIRVQAGYGIDGSINVDIGDELKRTTNDGTFGSFISGPGESFPGSTSLEDFDNDGILDVITVSTGNSFFFKGQGDGTFASGVTTTPAFAVYFGTGDFNGDGNADLASAGVVYYGNGDGTFQGANTLDSSLGGYSTMYDLDGDGDDEIINAGKVFSYQDDGSVLTTTIGASQESTQPPRIADMNGDGTMELFFFSSGAGFQIYSGDLDSGFSLTNSFSPDVATLSYEVADINNDGFADIIGGPQSAANGVRLYSGNGDGTFDSGVTIFTPTNNAVYIDVGDLNGDGILDLITGDFTGMDIAYLNLTGNATSSETKSILPGMGTQYHIVDINNDGINDIWGYGSSTGGVALGNSRETGEMEYLQLTTSAGARSAMSIIDDALDRVTFEKGSIGASRSRLESALNTISQARVNFESAKSRIQDADIAKETANLVLNQIRQQASAAILAQANATPEIALTLLE